MAIKGFALLVEDVEVDHLSVLGRMSWCQRITELGVDLQASRSARSAALPRPEGRSAGAGHHRGDLG